MKETLILISLLSITLLLSSCNCNWEWEWKCVWSYARYADLEFNSLEQPITVIWKEDSFWGWNVTVKANDWTIATFWNISTIAWILWASYEVWDLIK